AVGYTLDEIANDITKATPASFEPALDYVVVKVPRFDFAKFPATPDHLGTTMRSVGEAMAIGRTFPEAFQKALRSLETGRSGLNADPGERDVLESGDAALWAKVACPTPDRPFAVAELLRRGADPHEIHVASGIDPWFIDQMCQIVEERVMLESEAVTPTMVRRAKRMGFSDRQLAYLWGMSEAECRRTRLEWGIGTTFKTVDTCAAEFEAATPYFYGAFEDEDESAVSGRPTVVVLGSGPNRIGQGIEFDYCCVHAAMALRDAGYDTVMINCNPETVSTDYDTSDRLYFEPLTVEDVLAVLAVELPEAVVVQLGGQTPLNLAADIAAAGYRIAGTAPDAIDAAEDRKRFSLLCRDLGVPQPPHGTAVSVAEAVEVADQLGFPLLVRPSYVLGGRAMRVVYAVDELAGYLRELHGAAPGSEVDLSSAPVLIDRFLEAAAEVDVDAVFDGVELLVGGIMEHVEEAGVHSGDSACVVPPMSISAAAQEEILRHTEALARGLGVVGLINIQFAVRSDEVFVLEANPRASRTVPFISKATGVPIAKVATRVMMGASIEALRLEGLVADRPTAGFVAVKEAVMPWNRFPDDDNVLGPEMRATGEVMGIAGDFGTAYAKALLAAGHRIPSSGTVFYSLADSDKRAGLVGARRFAELGFRILATLGTARFLADEGIAATHVDKVGEGTWDPVRLIEEGKVDMVVNTPRGRRARGDGRLIRRAARRAGIPCVTSVGGGIAVATSLQSDRDGVLAVSSLQERHGWT
ncbi:carbamoyl-phosphate synthase large subunit, partial [bacterium]|nr:carbamoyl-phosphate synthase large subunit [bacterium]